MKPACQFCGKTLVNTSSVDAYCVNKRCYVNSDQYLLKKQSALLQGLEQQNIQHAINLLEKAGYTVSK